MNPSIIAISEALPKKSISKVKEKEYSIPGYIVLYPILMMHC